jgi:hypothetical protein
MGTPLGVLEGGRGVEWLWSISSTPQGGLENYFLRQAGGGVLTNEATSTESAGRILELAFRCGQPEFSKKGALIERNIMYFIRKVYCVQKRGSILIKIS